MSHIHPTTQIHTQLLNGEKESCGIAKLENLSEQSRFMVALHTTWRTVESSTKFLGTLELHGFSALHFKICPWSSTDGTRLKLLLVMLFSTSSVSPVPPTTCPRSMDESSSFCKVKRIYKTYEAYHKRTCNKTTKYWAHSFRTFPQTDNRNK